MHETRIYKDKVEINPQDVYNFYIKTKVEKGELNASFLNVNLSSGAYDIRNQKEKEALCSFLDDNNSTKKYRILEVGSGQGRWVDNLIDKYIDRYDGIDFCSSFIELAKEKYNSFSNINFYTMSIDNLDYQILKEEYDLIIICGVSMYINDDILFKLYKNLDSLIKKGAKLYLQESISTINQRLTLKNFYSSELKTNYNAIYRTPKEYISLINSSFSNLELKKQELILTKETGERLETNSCCFCYYKCSD